MGLSRILPLEQHYFSHGAPCFLALDDDSMTRTLPISSSIAQLQNAEWIGIGHSLGFANLLELPVRWNALCSLHGFTRFTATAENTEGTARRILERMIRQFNKDPERVIQEFLARCGMECREHRDLGNPEKLAEDLARMLDLNCAELLNNCLSGGSHLLCIQSENDAIVPQNLSIACFDSAVTNFTGQTDYEILQAQHAGPNTSPELYTKRLIDWFASLPNPVND